MGRAMEVPMRATPPDSDGPLFVRLRVEGLLNVSSSGFELLNPTAASDTTSNESLCCSLPPVCGGSMMLWSR